MDPFLEAFWNRDQVHGWAETRDPELVRAAAVPRYGKPKKWIEIAIRIRTPRPPCFASDAISTRNCGQQAAGRRKWRRLSLRRLSRTLRTSAASRRMESIAIRTFRCIGLGIQRLARCRTIGSSRPG